MFIKQRKTIILWNKVSRSSAPTHHMSIIDYIERLPEVGKTNPWVLHMLLNHPRTSKTQPNKQLKPSRNTTTLHEHEPHLLSPDTRDLMMFVRSHAMRTRNMLHFPSPGECGAKTWHSMRILTPIFWPYKPMI